MCPLSCHSYTQRGFSLIEIVIVLILLGTLGIVGANMISGSTLTNEVISNQNLAYSATRYAQERITREIREIEYLSASDAMNIVGPLSGTQLSFYKTTLSGTSTQVTLSYTAPSGATPGTLSLAYGNNTSQPLLTNLANATPFTYFLADGSTPTTDPKLVRYVGITLRVRPDYSKSPDLTLSNLIYFRNR